MFIIRLLGKVLAFPVVVVLMAVLIAVETFEKVIGFFVGLLNIMIVLVILYCLMVIHDYEMVKRAILAVCRGRNLLCGPSLSRRQA